MQNYCTPHIIKENSENFLIHRYNYIPLSQVYCVWQVVKTPTVISNNPVYDLAVYHTTITTVNSTLWYFLRFTPLQQLMAWWWQVKFPTGLVTDSVSSSPSWLKCWRLHRRNTSNCCCKDRWLDMTSKYGKLYPVTGHEGPEGVQYHCTLL
jgi:hypothetical protein